MNKKKRTNWEIFKEITMEAIYSLMYAIQFNLRYVANLMNLCLPYLMYAFGQCIAMDRGQFVIGGEVFIPIVIMISTHYIKEASNKVNKGTHIPIPEERFTEVTDDGEVSIEQDRIQELLLYTADLEDWMERKGWL